MENLGLWLKFGNFSQFAQGVAEDHLNAFHFFRPSNREACEASLAVLHKILQSFALLGPGNVLEGLIDCLMQYLTECIAQPNVKSDIFLQYTPSFNGTMS